MAWISLGHGHIVTSKGDQDAAAWGKRADWCDYHAPYKGKTYGIAIFDHPQNLRHPTWWMVRGYGLFAANPFGWHDFENLKEEPHKGDYTIPAGGSLTLRYRILFHMGDHKEAKLSERYRSYVEGKQPSPPPCLLQVVDTQALPVEPANRPSSRTGVECFQAATEHPSRTDVSMPKPLAHSMEVDARRDPDSDARGRCWALGHLNSRKTEDFSDRHRQQNGAIAA